MLVICDDAADRTISPEIPMQTLCHITITVILCRNMDTVWVNQSSPREAKLSAHGKSGHHEGMVREPDVDIPSYPDIRSRSF